MAQATPFPESPNSHFHSPSQFRQHYQNNFSYKRRRDESDEEAENLRLSGFQQRLNVKRAREVEETHQEDIPIYTSRHLAMLNQQKIEEFENLKQEFEQTIQTKDSDFQSAITEIQRLQGIEEECERVKTENKVLKRAVTIQNKQQSEAKEELIKLQQSHQQLLQYAHELERVNYALQVRNAQQSQENPFGDFHDNFPPPHVH